MFINLDVWFHIAKISNYLFYVGKSTNCVPVLVYINCLRVKAGHSIFQIPNTNAI